MRAVLLETAALPLLATFGHMITVPTRVATRLPHGGANLLSLGGCLQKIARLGQAHMVLNFRA